MNTKLCKYCSSPVYRQADELGATYRLICPNCKENNCTQNLLSTASLGELDNNTYLRLVEEWNNQN